MEVFSYVHATLHFLSIVPVVSRCLPGASLPATCWSLLGAHQKGFHTRLKHQHCELLKTLYCGLYSHFLL